MLAASPSACDPKATLRCSRLAFIKHATHRGRLGDVQSKPSLAPTVHLDVAPIALPAASSFDQPGDDQKDHGAHGSGDYLGNDTSAEMKSECGE